LDVDLLLYGEQKLALPTLTVPHAGIRERNFVLIPLAELNPNLIIHDRPITEYAASSDWSGLTRFTV
jgi:2-amino-4-hydroxy-6-hydroxymethyldihydropteridine diphosphokinase